MEFVAIDVETANADISSICQIGIALYRERILTQEWKTYIDPEDYFDEINILIHGIDEAKVKGAPIISDIASKIYGFLDGYICVSHTHFDRVAVQQAFDKYGLRQATCIWLDSALVARRTWKNFAWKGYGLGNICEFLGYTFTAHDALEDAKAAAYILNSAIDNTGLDIQAWLKRVKQPIDPSRSSSGEAIKRDGNPEGPLYGEVLVFTGALQICRYEAANMAAQIGCRVASSVTNKTTIVVVGDQDIKRLAGHEKSSKHRKAEYLISKGQSIRILRESDFKELAKLVD
jgi:DNA polymerase-3 subunit epsilon